MNKSGASAVSGDDNCDASLRVSKSLRDRLKAAAAVMGRPLYDVTNEVVAKFLSEHSPQVSLAGLRLAGKGEKKRPRSGPTSSPIPARRV